MNTLLISFPILIIMLKFKEKVYEEVSSIIGEEELRQEDINKMKYLDRVVKESLRIFPSVPAIGRTVTHDTILPSSK